MKRSLIVVWLIVYTALSAVGLPLTAHYCEGDFIGFELVEPESCCGDEAEKGCCQNEHTYLKADENHPLTPEIQTPGLQWVWLDAPVFYCPAFISAPAIFAPVNRSPHPPPLDACVQFGNFRI